MKGKTEAWRRHYGERRKRPLHFYPEAFLMRFFCSRFPRPVLDPERFPGASLLDLSCGYGRNLPFFQDLGFNLGATEISEKILAPLRRAFPRVEFAVGRNNAIPFADERFRYLVACQSCYYLDEGTTFADNLHEFARIITPGGIFVASIPGPGHSILDNATLDAQSVATVHSDRQNIRAGMLIQTARDEMHLRRMLEEHFRVREVGHFVDEFCGFVRDIYYVCAEKRQPFTS